MHLTKFTDNALRVLIFLSAEPERKMNITDIADACDIPRNHLTKVIHAMGQKGLLATVRGKGGGVSLAHAPDQLTVGQVVRAMEGTEEMVKCDQPDCPLKPRCNLRGYLRSAQSTFLKTLDGHTIADLLDEV